MTLDEWDELEAFELLEGGFWPERICHTIATVGQLLIAAHTGEEVPIESLLPGEPIEKPKPSKPDFLSPNAVAANLRQLTPRSP